MDIETLKSRLEYAKRSRIESAEEKKLIADKLLDKKLDPELRTILLESLALIIQLDLRLNDLEIQYERLIECRLFHAQYRQQQLN
jgi:hypothetical protein